MAHKSTNEKSESDAATTKRNLIASLELLRDNNTKAKTAKRHSVPAEEKNAKTSNQEIHLLHKEVKKLRSLNILLESDLKNMEQKALAAISEAGKFREMLDKTRDSNSANETRYYAEERQAILSELRHSRHTHTMLTQAVIESENEITRLTKTIEKLTMRFISA